MGTVQLEPEPFLTAAQAATRLRVSLATLYAYVSRGMIRSEPGLGRERRDPPEDVERVVRRREGGTAGAALHRGEPLPASALPATRPHRPSHRPPHPPPP